MTFPEARRIVDRCEAELCTLSDERARVALLQAPSVVEAYRIVQRRGPMGYIRTLVWGCEG